MKNIPKVAHLNWFGEQAMPHLNVFTVISFHNQNPDWKIKVYTSKQGNKDFGSLEWIPPYPGDDCFPMVKALPYVEIIPIDLTDFTCPVHTHIIAASDVFRQEILYREGGLYSDFDVIWLRPMEYFEKLNVIGNASDFQCTVSFYHTTHGFHNVSNIIAEKGSRFLYDLLQKTKEVEPPYTHQAFGNDLWGKVHPTLKDITSKYDRICALKYETFFPYSTFDLLSLYQKHDITQAYRENTMAVHWFGGNSLSHAYTDNDGFNRPCAMTSILKKEGLI